MPGNDRKAKIYLSSDNRKALDDQLQETFGETVEDLRQASQETRTARLVVRKPEMPPVIIKKAIAYVVPDSDRNQGFQSLIKPEIEPERAVTKTIYTTADPAGGQGVLVPTSVPLQVGEQNSSIVGPDLFSVATNFAVIYRLPVFQLLQELQRLYGAEGIVPETQLPALSGQIESQTQNFRLEEEEVEVALALIKPNGFDRSKDDEGNLIYTTEITYQKSREHLLLSWDELQSRNANDFGFHYDPYNFDSKPEKDFFSKVISFLDLDPDDVEDIYFTGGLSDPEKTDFFIEYKGEDGRWHRYSPDFLVRKKDDRCYIVEIKAENKRNDPIDGETGRKAMAVRGWERLNPERLQYEIIFAHGEEVGVNQLTNVKAFIESVVNHE
ncbi:MAG: TnsA endonuclease N-terminal domain-containing protein [Chloroflexota bacterium]|nr:TnsA endonuclease N-terminal domain-containing protein [Chloroflexota bacterium]